MDEECGFEFYSGHCNKLKPCPDHVDTKCVSCKEHAVRACDYEGQFVCGAPLCGECKYRTTDKVGFFGFYSHEHYSPLPISKPAPYTCLGAHCKCLNGKAGGCNKWHKGDHTCSISTEDVKHLSVTIENIKYVPEDTEQYTRGYKQGQIDMREIMLAEANKSIEST